MMEKWEEWICSIGVCPIIIPLFRLLPLIFLSFDWITTVLPVARMEERQIQAIENPRLGEAGVS